MAVIWGIQDFSLDAFRAPKHILCQTIIKNASKSDSKKHKKTRYSQKYFKNHQHIDKNTKKSAESGMLRAQTDPCDRIGAAKTRHRIKSYGCHFYVVFPWYFGV